MSGYKAVRLSDRRAAQLDEAARREAEARERARRETLRRAAEAAAAARLAAARAGVERAVRRLAELATQAGRLGAPLPRAIAAVAGVRPPPADAGLVVWLARQDELGRTAALGEACLAAAASLADVRQRSAFAAAIAGADSLEALHRVAGAWRDAAAGGGDALRVALRAREVLDVLGACAAAGLRLTRDQARLREDLERHLATPAGATRDAAVRAVELLERAGLTRRLQERKAHLVEVASRLLRERRDLLAGWRASLPNDLARLPALLQADAWTEAGAVVAEVDALFAERARLRLSEFLASVPPTLRAGPVGFDAERRAYVATLHDAHGELASVAHPATGWDVDDPDLLDARGPHSYSGEDCMAAGFAAIVAAQRAQGALVEITDARGVLLTSPAGSEEARVAMPAPRGGDRREEPLDA